MDDPDAATAVRGTRGIHPAGLILALVALYLVVSTISSQIFAFSGLVRFDLALGLVIPFSLLFGVFGIISGAIGVLIHDAVHSSLSETTLVISAAHLLLGYLAVRLWGQFGPLSAGTTPKLRSLKAFLEYLTVTIISSAATAAAIGWGNELLRIEPFYLAALVFLRYTLATIIVGIPFLYVANLVFSDRTIHAASIDARRPFSRFGLFVAAIASFWLIAGTVGSIGFRNAARLPSSAFTQYGIDFIQPLINPAVFGPGAVRIHAVFGAFMITTLIVLFYAKHQNNKKSQVEISE